MKKRYPYLEDAYYENPLISTKKRNFLSKINDFVNQKQYVKITLLNWEEKPLKEIQGQITSGSLTKDGSAAMRTTGTLAATFDAGAYSVEDANMDFAINKKIFIEIGIRNDTNEYKEYPILWFPQGVFFIGGISITSATGGVNLSITLKDKMACLNGDVGGKFSSTTILDVEESVDSEGNFVSQKVLLYDLITELVNHFGGEPLNNIIIEDVDLEIKRIMKWNGDSPLYLMASNSSKTDDNNDYTYQITTDTTSLEGEWQVLQKYTAGQDVGYIYDDFYYTSDLEAAPGDSVVTILDKIKSYLGNYEYFYDVFGLFHFREIKNYLNTTQAKDVLDDMNKNNYLIQTNSSKSSFTFSDDSNLISLSCSPQYDNIKNDFVIQGQKTSSTDATYPVMYHLAIDTKPTTGVIKYENFCIYQDEDEDVKKGCFPEKLEGNTTLPSPGNPSLMYLVPQKTLEDAGYDKNTTSDLTEASKAMLQSIVDLDSGNAELQELYNKRNSYEDELTNNKKSCDELLENLKTQWNIFTTNRHKIIVDTSVSPSGPGLYQTYKNAQSQVTNGNPKQYFANILSLKDIWDAGFADEATLKKNGWTDVLGAFPTKGNQHEIPDTSPAYNKANSLGSSWSYLISSEDKNATDYLSSKRLQEDFFVPSDFFRIENIEGVVDIKEPYFFHAGYGDNGAVYHLNDADDGKSVCEVTYKCRLPRVKEITLSDYGHDFPAHYHYDDKTYNENKTTKQEGLSWNSKSGYDFKNAHTTLTSESKVNSKGFLVDELDPANPIVYKYDLIKDFKELELESIKDGNGVPAVKWLFYEGFETELPLNFRLQCVELTLEYVEKYQHYLWQIESEKEQVTWKNDFSTPEPKNFYRTLTLEGDYNIESKVAQWKKYLQREKIEINYQISCLNALLVEYKEAFQNIFSHAKKAEDNYYEAYNKCQSALQSIFDNAIKLILRKNQKSGNTTNKTVNFVKVPESFDNAKLDVPYEYTSVNNGDKLENGYPGETSMEVANARNAVVDHGWYYFILNMCKEYYCTNNKPEKMMTIDAFADILNSKIYDENGSRFSCNPGQNNNYGLTFTISSSTLSKYEEYWAIEDDRDLVYNGPSDNRYQNPVYYMYGDYIWNAHLLNQNYLTNQNLITTTRSNYFPLIKAIFDKYISEVGGCKTKADEELDLQGIQKTDYSNCITIAKKYVSPTSTSEDSKSEDSKTDITLKDGVEDNTTSFITIGNTSYGLVQWEDSKYNFIPIVKYYDSTNPYVCKDWRTEIYMRGMLAKRNGTDSSQYYMNLVEKAEKGGTVDMTGTIAHADIVNPDFYFEELDAFWPQIYDLENQTWLAYENNDTSSSTTATDNASSSKNNSWEWHETLTQGSYYLDFVDAPNSGVNEFAIGNIGRRTDVVSDTDINCLFEPQIPDIIYANADELSETEIEDLRSKANNNGLKLMQLNSDLYYALYTGGNNNAAYDQVKYELYIHTLYQKTVSATALPCWWLQPNTRCTVNDKVTNTYGDFNIQSITLTLGAGSSMSVTMNEALERI